MDVGLADVTDVARRFVGDILQVPPMVSALKRDGRRLYELAREGEVVEREARPVHVATLDVVDVSPGPYPEVHFRVVCGKGTYVRSLADDMASALGGRAHLTALRRSSVGRLGLDVAVEVEDLDHAWQDSMIEPADALSHLPEVIVSPPDAEAVAHGARFAHALTDSTAVGEPYRVVDSDRRLLAVYVNRDHGARAEVVVS
jgi:tRNA pseudouridine55 synthase